MSPGCMYLKSNQPHTFVIISLDPPIRKGQTLYPHIVMQVFFFTLLVYGLLLVVTFFLVSEPNTVLLFSV
jgi:hypothetical protein